MGDSDEGGSGGGDASDYSPEVRLYADSLGSTPCGTPLKASEYAAAGIQRGGGGTVLTPSGAHVTHLHHHHHYHHLSPGEEQQLGSVALTRDEAGEVAEEDAGMAGAGEAAEEDNGSHVPAEDSYETCAEEDEEAGREEALQAAAVQQASPSSRAFEEGEGASSPHPEDTTGDAGSGMLAPGEAAAANTDTVPRARDAASLTPATAAAAAVALPLCARESPSAEGGVLARLTRLKELRRQQHSLELAAGGQAPTPLAATAEAVGNLPPASTPPVRTRSPSPAYKRSGGRGGGGVSPSRPGPASSSALLLDPPPQPHRQRSLTEALGASSFAAMQCAADAAISSSLEGPAFFAAPPPLEGARGGGGLLPGGDMTLGNGATGMSLDFGLLAQQQQPSPAVSNSYGGDSGFDSPSGSPYAPYESRPGVSGGWTPAPILIQGQGDPAPSGLHGPAISPSVSAGSSGVVVWGSPVPGAATVAWGEPSGAASFSPDPHRDSSGGCASAAGSHQYRRSSYGE